MREALRELEVEGLIENVPNRGPEVVRLKKSDAASIYQVRGVLEALAAKLFAVAARDEDIIQLRLALNDIANAYSCGEVGPSLSAKTRFYDILMRGAGNSVIPSILRNMNARINLLRCLSLASPQRLPESLREMQAIVAAIERRDAEGAFAASLCHVANSADAALSAVPD